MLVAFDFDGTLSDSEMMVLLEGLPASRAADAFDRVKLRPGAADVLTALAEAGHTTAILTGGFEAGVERALDAAGTGVDAVIANRLPVADGALTGDVEGPLVEGTKDEALSELATAEGVPMAETVAVGDGANDLPMLRVVGLAVGYAPKPAVEAACDETVDSMARLEELFERRGLL